MLIPLGDAYINPDDVSVVSRGTRPNNLGVHPREANVTVIFMRTGGNVMVDTPIDEIVEYINASLEKKQNTLQ